MALLKTIFSEVEREAPNTKKILASVPADKFNWRPHEKSMSLKQLATHIAQLQGMGAATLQSGNYVDLAEGPTPKIENTEDIVNLAENGVQATLSALHEAEDKELEKTFELRWEDKVLMSLPKGAFLRKMALSHTYHHRGQLSVYLRLLDIPVPGMYGPSADEK